MFDDDDPVLARVRRVALALPEAREKVSHGRPAFFTTKVFAYYGGSQKVEGVWVSHDQCVMVLLGPEERAAMIDDLRVFVPAYLGPSGWLGLELPSVEEDAGWDEVAELLDASYRQSAPKKLVAELDDRAGG